MNDILVIAKREFIERVRTKAFVIGTILGPIFMGTIMIVPAMMASKLAKSVSITVSDAEGSLRKAKQALDVACEERVQPLAIEGRLLGAGQEGRRQAAVKEALWEWRPECGQLVPEHGHEVNGALASGERVPELRARPDGRGAGRENLQRREEVGADLQDAGGVAELVNFVEDDHRLGAGTEKKLRVTDHVLNRRQVAVHILHLVGAKAFGQRGLAGAPDATQPRDGRFPPRLREPLLPEGPFDHATELYIKQH